MSISEPSITIPTSDVKWVRAILALVALKGFLKIYAYICILLGFALMLSIIGGAIQEVTSFLSDLWMHSDSLTRLILIAIAVYAVRKAVPYVVGLHTKGVL